MGASLNCSCSWYTCIHYSRLALSHQWNFTTLKVWQNLLCYVETKYACCSMGVKLERVNYFITLRFNCNIIIRAMLRAREWGEAMGFTWPPGLSSPCKAECKQARVPTSPFLCYSSQAVGVNCASKLHCMVCFHINVGLFASMNTLIVKLKISVKGLYLMAKECFLPRKGGYPRSMGSLSSSQYYRLLPAKCTSRKIGKRRHQIWSLRTCPKSRQNQKKCASFYGSLQIISLRMRRQRVDITLVLCANNFCWRVRERKRCS